MCSWQLVKQACSTCVSFRLFAMFVLFRETGRLWENWLITKSTFPSPHCDMSCAPAWWAQRDHLEPLFSRKTLLVRGSLCIVLLLIQEKFAITRKIPREDFFPTKIRHKKRTSSPQTGDALLRFSITPRHSAILSLHNPASVTSFERICRSLRISFGNNDSYISRRRQRSCSLTAEGKPHKDISHCSNTRPAFSSI